MRNYAIQNPLEAMAAQVDTDQRAAHNRLDWVLSGLAVGDDEALAIRLQATEGHSGYAYIFPAPDRPGDWQVSWCDAGDVPNGHEYRRSLRSALASAFGCSIKGESWPMATVGEYVIIDIERAER